MGGRIIWLILFCCLLCKGCAADAVLTADPPWSTLYIGETVTLTCHIEGEISDWEFKFNKDNRQYTDYYGINYFKFTIRSTHGGQYDCVGRHKSSLQTQKSNTVSFTVENKPQATLTSDDTHISVGGSVRLSCSVGNDDGWNFEFYRRPATTEERVETSDLDNRVIQISKGGIYRCKGVRKRSDYASDISNDVTVHISYTNKPVIKSQEQWHQIFDGEKISLMCDVRGGGGTDWWYEWRKSGSDIQGHNKILQVTVFQYDTGDYTCSASIRDDVYSSTEWSEAFRPSSSRTPKPELRSSNYNMSEGSTVTLTCSVESSGWTYMWYRDDKSLTTRQTGQYRVSREGRYQCRGSRGESIYYTDMSDKVIVTKIISNKLTLTLQPDGPQFYEEETVTLRCDVQGENKGWEYEWETTSPTKPPNLKEYRIEHLSSQHQGDYRCKGKLTSEQLSTAWSKAINLRVIRKPEPTLSVSPSWLIPGASVTLICQGLPAGWSFYWFRAIPESDNSYTYEPLPGHSSGTANNSFTLHGQTHTAGYACSAGRGDPVFYTKHSDPKYVWSSDVHPSVSLSVNPARVQHFTSQSLSLTCDGSSTQWRLIKFDADTGALSYPTPTSTNGSITINREPPSKAVYWCQSGTTFSRAVNISTQSGDVILVSPVYPVPAGESVTLRCELKAGNVPSGVFFYKDNRVIEKDTRGEMKISAVSESDQGFYKCQYNGEESALSWMAVKFTSPHQSSLFFLMWIIGLIFVILLFIFLLLLFRCYKQKKDPCSHRSVNRSGGTQQSCTTDHTSDQYENVGDRHASPDQEKNGCVTYSSIKLTKVKNVNKKKPEEATIYSDVRVTSSHDVGTYAEVLPKKCKAKGRKGRAALAITEATVYSEVKANITQAS